MLSIFPDDLTEEDEIYNLHALYSLEELNPNDTIEAADYDAEIYNWTSWISRQVFYVCSAPTLDNTYILFSLNWDDNWGRWERLSHCAIRASLPIEEAKIILLNEFAKDHIDNISDDNDPWSEFIKTLV